MKKVFNEFPKFPNQNKDGSHLTIYFISYFLLCNIPIHYYVFLFFVLEHW